MRVKGRATCYPTTATSSEIQIQRTLNRDLRSDGPYGSNVFAELNPLATLLPIVFTAMMHSRATSMTNMPYSINAAPSSFLQNSFAALNIRRPVGVMSSLDL